MKVGFREAPPTRKPSMFGFVINSYRTEAMLVLLFSRLQRQSASVACDGMIAVPYSVAHGGRVSKATAELEAQALRSCQESRCPHTGFSPGALHSGSKNFK